MVRTPGFHPGNRGSIPLGTTKTKSVSQDTFFVLVMVELGNRTGWKRDARDGGSRNERTSVGQTACGSLDANPGQVSPPLAGGGRGR